MYSGTVASGHRSLVVRSVIPGPVVCPIPEFLEHFVEKCRAWLVRHWMIQSVVTMICSKSATLYKYLNYLCVVSYLVKLTSYLPTSNCNSSQSYVSLRLSSTGSDRRLIKICFPLPPLPIYILCCPNPSRRGWFLLFNDVM